MKQKREFSEAIAIQQIIDIADRSAARLRKLDPNGLYQSSREKGTNAEAIKRFEAHAQKMRGVLKEVRRGA